MSLFFRTSGSLKIFFGIFFVASLFVIVFVGFFWNRNSEQYVSVERPHTNGTDTNLTHELPQNDDVITERTDAYELELTLPNASVLYSDDIRASASIHRAQFIEDAKQALSEYKKDPGYSWQTYVLSGGYELYKTGSYTFFVLNEYYYTGGANGTQIVYSFGYNDSTAITLSDLIIPSARAMFLQLVQADLYRQNGITASDNHVFGDAIAELTFEDMENFYLTSENVVVLFSEYDVAPGALGAVRVTIPRTTVGI